MLGMQVGSGGWLSMRRVLAGALAAVALLLVAATGAPAGASDRFSDVPDGHAFHDEIAWLADSGITTGWPDGTFRPGEAVSRQAMAAFLARVDLVLGGLPVTMPADPGFVDVGPGHPFFDQIAWLAAAGITTGYPDGTFRPTEPVSRQAMAAFLQRLWALRVGPPVAAADPGFADVGPGHPFADEIAWLAGWGITAGYPDGGFHPTDVVSRQAMAAFLQRFATAADGPCDSPVTDWADVPPCAPAPTTTFTVDTSTDATDTDPGDGSCDTGTGACTLRAAIVEANALDVPVEILLDVDHVNLTRIGAGEDAAATGDLDITTDIRLAPAVVPDRPGPADVVTVDAFALDRVLDVRAGSLTAQLVRLTNGATTDSGAAIRVWDGATLRLVDSVVDDATADAGTGGIKTLAGSTTILDRVTLHHLAGSGGGAVLNAGALVALNTTISTNGTGDGTGAGITTADGATTWLGHTTITANDGSGLDTTGDATVQLWATIVADQTLGADCTTTTPTTDGGNLDSDGTCLTTPTTGDQPLATAALEPLGPSTGPTPVHRPGPTSHSHDAIPAGTAHCGTAVTTDQQHLDRPTGTGCEPGAAEDLPIEVDLVVTHGHDAPDAAPGDGTCDTGTGACTLRAAIDEANALGGAQGVLLTVDATLGAAGVDEDANATGDLDITDDLTIYGPSRAIDADGIDRVLDATAPLVLVGATVTGGSTDGDGGGIRTTADLTLDGATIVDNHAVGLDVEVLSGGLEARSTPISSGGGVHATGGAVALEGTTVADNTATAEGGGIHQVGGTLAITASTVAANEATRDWRLDGFSYTARTATSGGGGLRTIDVDVALAGATLEGNRASRAGGGILADGGSLSMADSRLVGNDTRGGDRSSGEEWYEYEPVGRGGGLAAVGSSITIERTTISDNQASRAGGGAWMDGGTGSIDSSTIKSNEAAGNATQGSHQFWDEDLDARGDGGGIFNGSNALQVEGSRIEGNRASVTGGGIAADGAGLVDLVDTQLTGNAADGFDTFDLFGDWPPSDAVPVGAGGAVHARQPVTLRDATVIGNLATSTGGGIVATEELEVERTAIVANRADSTSTAPTTIAPVGTGGGLVIDRTDLARLEDVTVSGNAADGSVGGILADAQVTGRFVTVVDNGDVGLAGDGWTLTASVVGGHATDCTDPVTSGGHNISSDASCGLGEPTDQPSTPHGLSGGASSPYRLPLDTSAALDAIPVGTPLLCDGTVPTDQAGEPRPVGPGCDAGAAEGSIPDATLDLVVDWPGDAPDADPTDGTCATIAGSCTLRAAIDETNLRDGRAHTIALATDVALVAADTGPGAQEDDNLLGDLDVRTDVTVDGDGHTVDGQGLHRIVDHHSGLLTLTDLTLTDGRAPTGGAVRSVAPLVLVDTTVADSEAERGGGVHATAGLAITGSTFTGNHADDDGGAVHATGDLTLVASTLAGNAAGGDGGALRATGTATLDQLTVQGNTAGDDGGGAALVGPSLVDRSTFADNTADDAGGGLQATGDVNVHRTTLVTNTARGGGGAATGRTGAGEPRGSLALVASTVAGNTATYGTSVNVGTGATAEVRGSILAGSGDECAGAVASGGHNLVADASCGFAGTGDQVTASVLLAPIGDGGGPTATRLVYPSCPAVDAIPAGTAGLCDGTLPTDQRGAPRPDGAACDVGAVEGTADFDPDPLALVVDDGGDAPDAVPGDGVCDTGTGACTLRAALDEADAWPTADAIALAVDVTLSLAGAGDDANATGDLDVWTEITLDGAGHTIDADGIDRVLDVHTGQLVLQHVTITSGSVSGGGGGIRSHAELVVERSTIVGNTASSGGGIAVAGGTALIDATTVAGNEVTFDGGGLWRDRSAEVAVQRSTFADNRTGVASYRTGGAIHDDGRTGSPPMTVTASTFVGNWAPIGSAFGHWSASTPPLVLAASAVHEAGPACQGPVASGGWNHVAEASCELDGPGEVEGGSLVLAPVGDGGGPTPTAVPHPGSPLLDAIPAGTPGLCDGTLPTDQRGLPRPVGAGCDVGAVEGDNGVPISPLALVVDDPADLPDAVPGDGICDAGAGTCTLRAAVDEANAWPTADAIALAVDPVLAVAGTGEDANATGDLDVWTELTIDGAGHTIDGGGIDRVLDHHTASLSVADVTIANGALPEGDGGGGIRSRGVLSLTDATVADSSTAGSHGGGGVLVRGVATVERTTITANEASGYGVHGGGVSVLGGWLVLRDSTIAGNLATATDTAEGGGLHVGSGVAAVEGTVIADNVATGWWASGGGVATDGILELTESSVRSNQAQAGGRDATGGGIAVRGGGADGVPAAAIVATTVRDNVASSTERHAVGGGIDSQAELEVTSSTLARNQVVAPAGTAEGGGLRQAGSKATVRRSTIINNSAAHAQAVSAWDDRLTLGGTIVQSGVVGGSCAGGQRILSEGWNVVADTSCALGQASDQNGVGLGLTPLGDRGGPTWTYLPSAASAVLDLIPPGTAGLCDGATATDQRGEPRPVGAGCDAGAVERQADDP